MKEEEEELGEGRRTKAKTVNLAVVPLKRCVVLCEHRTKHKHGWFV